MYSSCRIQRRDKSADLAVRVLVDVAIQTVHVFFSLNTNRGSNAGTNLAVRMLVCVADVGNEEPSILPELWVESEGEKALLSEVSDPRLEVEVNVEKRGLESRPGGGLGHHPDLAVLGCHHEAIGH